MWMCVVLRLWVNVPVKVVIVRLLQQVRRRLVDMLLLVVRLGVWQRGSRLRRRWRRVVSGSGTSTGMVPVAKRRRSARDGMRAWMRGAFLSAVQGGSEDWS